MMIVTALAPMRPRMLPKLGTLAQINSIMNMTTVLKINRLMDHSERIETCVIVSMEHN